MNDPVKRLLPAGGTKYLFFGGKGGVGKTTLATATATWLADHGYETTIVSTDPTVSLSVMFDQQIRGDALAPIHAVPRLCGLNINPRDAKGAFQQRLDSVMGQLMGAFGPEIVGVPCAEEMATFDQFVSFLQQPRGDVIVFDTAPTGKTLRELAMPFNWAAFLQQQIKEGREVARLMNMDEASLADLERDKRRYEDALAVLRDPVRTVFTLVLLPERLPIEETKSAIAGLIKLGIGVQRLVVNQVIEPAVVQGNPFLAARARLQEGYLREIEATFNGVELTQLPLLASDVSAVANLRDVGRHLYGSLVSAAAV